MNYIEEIRAFYDWLVVNSYSLSPGAIALWHALMHINNKAGWKAEFMVANRMLECLTGLSRWGVDEARNRLIQLGLIEYTKGTGRKPGKYKIRPLSQIVNAQVAPTNQQIIAELTTQYRKIVPLEKHSPSDYAFIGKLYLDHGIDAVKAKLVELERQVLAGYVPEKPLVYLKAMLSKSRPKRAASSLDWMPEE